MLKKSLALLPRMTSLIVINSVYIIMGIFFSVCVLVSIFVYSISTPAPAFIKLDFIFSIGNLLLMFVFFLVFFLLFFLLYKVHIRFKDKKKLLIPIAMILYVIIQTLFVLLVPVSALADSKAIKEIALALLDGSTKIYEQGSYLSSYPNNIGITLYNSLLYLIFPNSLLVPRLFNVIFTSITVYYTAKFFQLSIKGSDQVFRFILLVLMIIPIPIIMNNYAYGDVPSTCFCVLGMYFGLKYYRERKVRYLLFTIVYLIFGMFLRSSGLLFILSLSAFFILQALRDTSFMKRGLVGAVIVMVLAMNLPLVVFDYVSLKTGYIKESVFVHAQPTSRWINMGFPGKMLGYYDKGETTSVYRNKFKFNKEKTNKYLMNQLKRKIIKTPVNITGYNYFKKVFWLWTEGTYQMNYYPLTLNRSVEPEYNTPISNYLENNKDYLKIGTSAFFHSLNLLLLILLALAIFSNIKNKNYNMLLAILVIFMFFIFYTFWELKSRYIYATYFMIAPIAMLFLLNIFEKKSAQIPKLTD